MAITANEDFPRSDGTKQTATSSTRSSFVREDDQLFKKKKNAVAKKSVRLGHKPKTVSKGTEFVSAPQKLNKVVIENMTLSRLSENITVSGCILEIDNFELKFSVTGGIVVKVPITNISTPYSKLIEDFANDSLPENFEIAKLTSIFQIGDYYPLKILSKKVCDQFGHTEIVGSINPKDIYSNFTTKSVNSLPSGFNFVAAVCSLEDYGYEMDIGISGIKAFLPIDDLSKNLRQSTLQIGQLVRCALSQNGERSVTLSANKKFFNFCFEDEHDPSVYSYIPGTITKCTVSDVHNAGLEVALPGGYRGFVPRYHISDDILALPKKFTIGDTVQGLVLYIQPHTKQVCISLKSKLSKKSIKNLLSTLKPGLIIKGAVICGVGEFGTNIFRLPSSSYAICSRKNLCDTTEYENLKLKGHFSLGSAHICRVKKFHLFDNTIEISLKKSFIERNELSVEDLKLGAIVDGTVKKLGKNGIYLQLGFGLNGFIPNMHLTDGPLVNLSKNREKMFSEKRKIKCRITRLDTSSRVPKISLTCKKTLLNMVEADIFTDYREIQPGSSSTGAVCLINDKGVLLEFFGRVCGFIPTKYLATYKIEHPEKVFSLGQLIKCTVISVDTDAQRMVCSLINASETKKLKIKTSLTEKKLQNSALQVGQVLKKMKIISKVAMKGFDLTNQKQDIQVFLPLAHLSDDTYLSRLLYTAFKVGETMEQVMVFSVDSANVVTVTRKSAFLHHRESLVVSESDILMNKPFPVIVRNVTHNGVFFETPNSQFGVVRRRQLQDGFNEDPQRLGLLRGQTIFVSAVDLILNEDENEEKGNSHLKRYKFSMKLSDVWDKEDTARVDYMKSYIDEFSLAIRLFKSGVETNTTEQSDLQNSFQALAKKFASFCIGQAVTYVVTNISEKTIESKISLTGAKNESTVAGIAQKYTDFDELNVAQMGNAIICDIDFDRRVLLVFIQPSPAKIVKQMKNVQKIGSVKNVKVGQSIKGTVIYIGKRYVLASLAGHVPGVVAYIPSRRHRNDFGQIEKLFSVGEDYHFSIKHIDEHDRVIATLNTDSKKTDNKQEKAKKAPKTTNEQQSLKMSIDLPSVGPISVSRKEESSLHFDRTLRSSNANATLQTPNEFQWDIPDLTPNLSKKRKIDEANCPDQKEDEDEDLDKLLAESDSDDESTTQKKRKTRQERSDEARQREMQLRQKEIELSNTERNPQSEQDFEMAVVASPNSSLVWLKFMSFYLEKADTAKARDVAERALQRISFREEKEKLNIWIGLMNLENTYGDQASMDALVERAIKYNDAKTVYLQLASIYNNSDKKEKAEQIHHLTLKKFKQDKSVWIEFLVFFMQNGRFESARKQFQKSLLSLEKRDHVDVISKFAQLEFRFGDAEQAKTIFESMLATYWKRLDQWSIYIDMLVKYTLVESNLDTVECVRNIFERLITFKLPPQKMKFIFKKYYDFEVRFSAENSEILDRIKQKALEYIESDIF